MSDLRRRVSNGEMLITGIILWLLCTLAGSILGGVAHALTGTGFGWSVLGGTTLGIALAAFPWTRTGRRSLSGKIGQ